MNNIYVLPDVHNIFIARVGFTLIRVHRSHTESGISNQSKKQLSSLKWPIERMYFGVRPNANNNDMDLWWSYSSSVKSASSDVAGPDTAEGYIYQTLSQTTSTISIELHGQPLYSQFPTEFFTDYMPTVFGGTNVSASEEDPSACMFTFGLFPGMYQPNGHLNTSRAREIYMDWQFTTAWNNGGSPATTDLILEADAINFLLISDGNAVLRYST